MPTPRDTRHPQSVHEIEPAHCSRCDAVCCRLTVVLQPEDRIPAHLTTTLPSGLHVMARDEEGWCVALDGARMNCGIYESRPDVCRRFVMDGPYCNAIRADYAQTHARAIELVLQNP
jgi:Fe-S-cluster containining protein